MSWRSVLARRHHRQREPQAGERRAQIVRDAGQHLGALEQETAHALLHPVECGAGPAHLGGAFRPDRTGIATHAEGLGGRGEAANGTHLVPHEQSGDQEQHARRTDDPDQEDIDRAGVEALAGDPDVEHALGQLDTNQHGVGVRGPVHGEGQAHHVAQRRREIVVDRAR